jgi:hypothetical protein
MITIAVIVAILVAVLRFLCTQYQLRAAGMDPKIVFHTEQQLSDKMGRDAGGWLLDPEEEALWTSKCDVDRVKLEGFSKNTYNR